MVPVAGGFRGFPRERRPLRVESRSEFITQASFASPLRKLRATPPIHFDDEGLAGGHVEGVDQAREERERDDFPDSDDAGEREDGQREGLKHREDLSDDDGSVAIPAVDPDAGDGSEDEGRDLAGEADDSEEDGGTGEAIDEPAGGDAGHPGADQRNALAGEEELVVAGAEGAGREGEVHRKSADSGYTPGAVGAGDGVMEGLTRRSRAFRRRD